jgi:hypothetical protein
VREFQENGGLEAREYRIKIGGRAGSRLHLVHFEGEWHLWPRLFFHWRKRSYGNIRARLPNLLIFHSAGLLINALCEREKIFAGHVGFAGIQHVAELVNGSVKASLGVPLHGG